MSCRALLAFLAASAKGLIVCKPSDIGSFSKASRMTKATLRAFPLGFVRISSAKLVRKFSNSSNVIFPRFWKSAKSVRYDDILFDAYVLRTFLDSSASTSDLSLLVSIGN